MFVPNAAMRGRGRRGGGADPWFLVMAYQLWQQIERLGPNKPRVTLACMALAAALHFNLLGDVGDAFLGASSADACVSAHRVLSRREWWRLLASPLRFADDLNLVVNLTSFLHKGHVLERARGPEGFARLLPILLLATNLAYVAVAHLAHRLRLFDARRACLVGTTALNFALRRRPPTPTEPRREQRPACGESPCRPGGRRGPSSASSISSTRISRGSCTTPAASSPARRSSPSRGERRPDANEKQEHRAQRRTARVRRWRR